jgi:hypothetical protein
MNHIVILSFSILYTKNKQLRIFKKKSDLKSYITQGNFRLKSCHMSPHDNSLTQIGYID